MSKDAKKIFEAGDCSVYREYSGQYRMYIREDDSLKMITLLKGIPAAAFSAIADDLKPAPVKRKPRKKKEWVDVTPGEVGE